MSSSTCRLLAGCLALVFTVSPALAIGAGQALSNPSALGDERNVALRLQETGTVTAVDAGARLMAVNGPRGSITFRLDPLVPNAGDIQVGERVQVDYVAAFILTRRASAREARRAQVRRPDGPPADLQASYERPVPFVKEVLMVDKDNLVLRLRGSEGEIQDFVVHDRAALAGVRTGDRLLVSMNQAVAVGVTTLPR